MKMTKSIISIIFLMFITACGGLPKHETAVSVNTPQIKVLNAPIGASVYINNKSIGVITKDKKTFSSTTGTHQIKVFSAEGSEIFSATIYLSNNHTKEITIH